MNRLTLFIQTILIILCCHTLLASCSNDTATATEYDGNCRYQLPDNAAWANHILQKIRDVNKKHVFFD